MSKERTRKPRGISNRKWTCVAVSVEDNRRLDRLVDKQFKATGKHPTKGQIVKAALDALEGS